MKENILLYAVMIIQVVAVVLQCSLYVHYKRLAKESGRMQTTTNETLKQMKLKYENYRRLDVFIPDVEAFISRYLDAEKVFHIEEMVISNFIYILQFMVAALGVWQTFFSLEKGIIIGFTMIMFYCICKLFDYIDAENRAAIKIREFFAKSDHGRLKEKREDKQTRQTMTENVQEGAQEQGEDSEEVKVAEDIKRNLNMPEHIPIREASNVADDISMSEAAVYDMLSELFDL